MAEDRAMYANHLWHMLTNYYGYKDGNGLCNMTNPPKTLVGALRKKVRTNPQDTLSEPLYTIWVHVHDMHVFPNHSPDQPRFLFEADVRFAQNEFPFVNLTYGIREAADADKTADAIWRALGCPTGN
jgi:hypothetical protein